MEERVSTQASISRMLEQSRELKHSEDQKTSSEDEGWGEKDVAPGQQLSDYRPLNQSLPFIESAPKITAADYAPLPNTLRKYVSKDVRVNMPSADSWCGLQNLGNTCYMNAGLQCLCSVPQFAAHFLGAEQTPASQPREDNISDDKKEKLNGRAQLNSSFCVLLRKLWCGQFTSLHPKAFKMCLGLIHSPFSGSRQQDCQEFLAVLLDQLHEHLMDGHTPPFETIVSQTFQGQLKNEVECLHCGHRSTKLEPFVYLSLPLPGAHQRQIEVHWVPAVGRHDLHLQVNRLLVTVLKQDSVLELKSAVCELVGRAIDKDLLVTVEVLQGSISRPLGNGIALKQLLFRKGEKLYCFEMLSLTELTSSLHSPDPWSPNMPPSSGVASPSDCLPQNDSPAVVSGEDHPAAMSEDYDAFGSKPFITQSESKPVPGSSAVVMDWRTCSVCLEELLDSELMVHPECGGVLCSTCLKSTVQHYSSDNKQMPCPICSVSVLPLEAFCPLSSRTQSQPSEQQKVISFLQIVLLMRDKEGKLFGHPVITHLPCEANGAFFYKIVSTFLPENLINLQWSICLTDAKGRYCSRCPFESFCSGCPLQRSTGSEVKLKPGDHLTISFSDALLPDQLNLANHVNDHSSFLNGSSNKTLTLAECLQAFIKSEHLAEDNPWFCSSCNCQQKALRTLKVNRIPPVLIIHLKRFMYHSGGSKLEIPVEFPMELDPKEVCPDMIDEAPPLHLVAMVCHFGTLQGGHYTAYVRNPLLGSWSYCNDSKVSQSTPSSSEAESVYILFYVNKSESVGLDHTALMTDSSKFDDETEMMEVEHLMLSSKNSIDVSLPVPIPGQLKRTNSNPDMHKNEPPSKPTKRLYNMSPF